MTASAPTVEEPGRRRLAGALALAALLALLPAPAHSQGEIVSELTVGGLDRPLLALSPEGDGRLFILERAGLIRILLGGSLLPTPFLDIRSRVSTAGERGLLGLAFAPDFARSGVFYLHYSNRSGDSVYARYRLSDDPDLADPDSEEILLLVDQPFANHNGGSIAFGRDGYLYVAPGDGGSGFDPAERSQNPQSLLGKMLRIDVSGGPGEPYAIPPDNPFVDDPGVLDEIWAFGLRNPYRWSFDRETGDLWIADVGQGRSEEVDFEPAGDPGGRNYGWDVMEGTLCNRVDPAPAPPCNDPSLTLPVFEYPHVFGLCSITGGFVSRGPNPDIDGLYFFADFCTGVVWSFDRERDQALGRTEELAPGAGGRFRLVGFGEDGAGELYLVNRFTDAGPGEIYRIRSPLPACSDGFDNDGDGLSDADDPACADPLQDGELPRDDLRVELWPRKLDPGRAGKVLAFVFGSEQLDLSLADPTTLGFGPAAAPPASGHAPFRWDLNHDGYEDWIVPFRVDESGLVEGDREACVQLEQLRVPVRGCDEVRVKSFHWPWWRWRHDRESDAMSVETGEDEVVQLAAAAPASSDPPVLQYVAPSEGCRRWNDCGWVWAPPGPAALADGESLAIFPAGDVAAVPALGPLGLALTIAALLAAGTVRRRR